MIAIEELVVRFGTHRAVDGVSLTVADGELLVLVGGSGSGKTTMLRTINRLVEPASGRVRVGGRDVREQQLDELRRSIGYVLQRFGLFPHLTVADNIALPLQLARVSRARMDARLDELLQLVELPAALKTRYPRELSGGQQQRVSVARALATEPRVMLLDEPFGALDPLTRDRLQQTFLDLRARSSFTAVLVTHDMSEALLLGDRIAVMRSGKLIQVGSPQEILASPADEEVEQMLATPRRHAERFERLLRA